MDFFLNYTSFVLSERTASELPEIAWNRNSAIQYCTRKEGLVTSNRKNRNHFPSRVRMYMYPLENRLQLHHYDLLYCIVVSRAHILCMETVYYTYPRFPCRVSAVTFSFQFSFAVYSSFFSPQTFLQMPDNFNLMRSRSCFSRYVVKTLLRKTSFYSLRDSGFIIFFIYR